MSCTLRHSICSTIASNIVHMSTAPSEIELQKPCCTRYSAVTGKRLIAGSGMIYEVHATKQQRKIIVQHTPRVLSSASHLKQGASGGRVYEVPPTGQLKSKTCTQQTLQMRFSFEWKTSTHIEFKNDKENAWALTCRLYPIESDRPSCEERSFVA